MKERTKNLVLYVDDEEVNLFLFSKIFENDFDTITASSGHEGLEKLKKNSEEIKVVISDMRMPSMDGLEFINTARNEFKNPFYFILTGYEFNPDLEKALEANLIDKIFKKPFDYELIKTAVSF